MDTWVNAKIDMENRLHTARNHTATHLLHKALREVVGPHVEQSGSLVTADKLRFDFSHFQALTAEEISKVELLVNKKVLEGLTILGEEMGIDQAKEKGATALFGEKYGDTVRVVSMGTYSMELCGGTHLTNTSQVGLFKILSEGGVAAGIRRIEAVTGFKSYEYMLQEENKMVQISAIVKTNPREVVGKVENLIHDLKAAQKEIEILKGKLAGDATEEILKNIIRIKDINVITHKLSDMDMESLRSLGDQLKDKLGSGLVVLASEKDNKVNFIAMATQDVVTKGIHAGNIIKEISKIAGGGGGGKPTMAQAGAKDPSKIDEALNKVLEIVKLAGQ